MCLCAFNCQIYKLVAAQFELLPQAAQQMIHSCTGNILDFVVGVAAVMMLSIPLAQLVPHLPQFGHQLHAATYRYVVSLKHNSYLHIYFCCCFFFLNLFLLLLQPAFDRGQHQVALIMSNKTLRPNQVDNMDKLQRKNVNLRTQTACDTHTRTYLHIFKIM